MPQTKCVRCEIPCGERLEKEHRAGQCLAMRTLSAILVLLSASFMFSCGGECRDIEFTPVEFECDIASAFIGEIHFDRAAIFETFLNDECLPGAAPERIAEIAALVDFDRDAIVVARGANSLNDECLAEREINNAQVCRAGLRFDFEDVISEDAVCETPVWNIAFTLARADLRAALDGIDAQ